ncbi:MAG: cysteine rich repeat-containing protein [Nitrospirae bacterium]|nr:cysteine rich repeat-containing protein [Nitrospirota bacterium]
MKRRMILSRTSIRLFTVIVALFCLSLYAGTGVSAENKGPCADDVAKFCKDVKPSEGAIANCLKEHASELSAGCKETLAAAKQKVQDFTEACKNDMSKFCKDVKPGGGRILQCLKGHENELSPECKAKMTSAK